MSICTGRTPEADEVLQLAQQIELAIPMVSFIEAHHAFKKMKAAKTFFRKPFGDEIGDIGRDPGLNAQEFAKMLAAADNALDKYLVECELRFTGALEQLALHARHVISPSGVIARREHSYLSDPTDDLIAGSVLADALLKPTSSMAFLSEDSGYKQPTLRDAMTNARVTVFDSAATCLKWCKA